MIKNTILVKVAQAVLKQFPKSIVLVSQNRIEVIDNGMIAKVFYNKKKEKIRFSTTRTFVENEDYLNREIMSKIAELLLDLYLLFPQRVSVRECKINKINKINKNKLETVLD